MFETAPSVIRSMRSITILPSTNASDAVRSAVIGSYFWITMVPSEKRMLPRYSPALVTVTSRLGATARQSDPKSLKTSSPR